MIKKIFNLIKKKIIIKNSYSNFILKNNCDYLIKKIFEEFIELILIFNNYIKKKKCINKYFLIKEICDLIYHILLFIIYNNISIFEIEKEFLRRNKISGINEKFFR